MRRSIVWSRVTHNGGEEVLWQPVKKVLTELLRAQQRLGAFVGATEEEAFS